MILNETTVSVYDFNLLLDKWDRCLTDYKLDIKKAVIAATCNNKRWVVHLNEDNYQNVCPGGIWSAFVKKAAKSFNTLEGKYGYKKIYLKDGRVKIEWDIKSKVQTSYVNEKYINKFNKCWSYDINSAFSYAMLQQMPDTTVEPRLLDRLKDGEIGFNKNGTVSRRVGSICDYIFPLIESPFKDYVDFYYNKKCKAIKGSEDRERAKAFLNIPTGLLQHYNIFYRNAILYYSNQYIESFIDDDTVYCNVDSIISLKPRQVPIGKCLGEFKEEHSDEWFKAVGVGKYQWGRGEDAVCHYSGIPTNTLKDVSNLEDRREYKYRWDESEGRIKLNEKRKKS